MRTPVPKLIRRPSRSAPSVGLALLLLAAGGLGTWLTGHRIVTGTWPDRTVTTIGAIGSATLGSAAVLAVAGIAAACGLAMILAALWPGLPERVEILPDDIPGQTAADTSSESTPAAGYDPVLFTTKVLPPGYART